MHDSLHTFEHQLFEYRLAWPNRIADRFDRGGD
jgi:hypothetical protein